MKKTLITGIAALFLATGTAHADGPKQTLVGEWYFNGMMAGFGAANSELEFKGQQPLFCPPENLTLTGDILQDLIRTFANQHPEIRKHASGSTGMEVVALLALQDTFPCKPQ